MDRVADTDPAHSDVLDHRYGYPAPLTSGTGQPSDSGANAVGATRSQRSVFGCRCLLGRSFDMCSIHKREPRAVSSLHQRWNGRDVDASRPGSLLGHSALRRSGTTDQFSYQWRKNWRHIPGAPRQCCRLLRHVWEDKGSYTVRITDNQRASRLSPTSSADVSQGTAINSQPKSRLLHGSAMILSVDAEGARSYQCARTASRSRCDGRSTSSADISSNAGTTTSSSAAAA